MTTPPAAGPLTASPRRYAQRLELVDTYFTEGGGEAIVPDRLLIDGVDISGCLGYRMADRRAGWSVELAGSAVAVRLDFLPGWLECVPFTDGPGGLVQLLHPAGPVSLWTVVPPGHELGDGVFTLTEVKDLRASQGNGPIPYERVWVYFSEVVFRLGSPQDRQLLPGSPSCPLRGLQGPGGTFSVEEGLFDYGEPGV